MVQKFFSLLRVCSICGSVSGQHSIYCFRCRMLEEDKALHSTWNYETSIQHHYLFDICNERKDHHYRQLISLKENPCPILEAWLMRLLTRKRIRLKPDISKDPMVVPAPSSTGRMHSHRLAKELSRQTGWPYFDLFAKKAKRQKDLSWFDRNSVEVEVIRELPPSSDIILVDDLVTTGSTAISCKNSLTNCKSFEVWAPYRTVLLHPYDPFAITQQDEKTNDCNTFNISNGQW